MTDTALTWTIAAAATLGVILRPFRWPEWPWACAGPGLLVALGLLPADDAWAGIARGTDVYLFLAGMMLLAELARREGLFNWLAACAANAAHGSGTRLFTLTYATGTLVTVFLSNDATAVVMTPAIAAVVRTARAENPLPYLVACAFVANAASFVLPISNPANLVIYGAHMPRLGPWLGRFALPSVLAILATWLLLRLSQRHALRQPVASKIDLPTLPAGGRIAAVGIGCGAVLLLLASAMGWPLGLPTLTAGLLTLAAVLIRTKGNPLAVLRGISWGVLPLVAGLFVLVAALQHTGLVAQLSHLLQQAGHHRRGTAFATGTLLALACNLMNNLPAGLIAGTAVQGAGAPHLVSGAVLIGTDLGPNLSVTGSLATILWLTALKRDGLHVSAGTFLRLGLLVMPVSLLLALGALVLTT